MSSVPPLVSILPSALSALPPTVLTAGFWAFPLYGSEVAERLASMTGSPVSADFAQDAVNEIYARNGFVFRSENLRSYYQSQSWYHADPYFSPNDLNEIELYNIGVINQYAP